MTDLGAVVAFFSPSDYVLPKKHLQRVLKQLCDKNIPVVVAQVVHPNKNPEPVPENVVNRVWQSTHTLFWKENLWNLGAQILPTKNLLFIDSDVIFAANNWAPKISQMLDEYDLIQPFENCVWLNQNSTGIELQRKCSAVALKEQINPNPAIYHPGFAWACRRDSFIRMGGWYEFHPAGGGDTATAYALAKQEHGDHWHRNLRTETWIWKRQSFQRYRARAQSAGLKIGYIAGDTIQHLWHGARELRRYTSRHTFMPQVGYDEFPLQHRPDGLLEWTDEIHNVNAQAYFDQRREDG